MCHHALLTQCWELNLGLRRCQVSPPPTEPQFFGILECIFYSRYLLCHVIITGKTVFLLDRMLLRLIHTAVWMIIQILLPLQSWEWDPWLPPCWLGSPPSPILQSYSISELDHGFHGHTTIVLPLTSEFIFGLLDLFLCRLGSLWENCSKYSHTSFCGGHTPPHTHTLFLVKQLAMRSPSHMTGVDFTVLEPLSFPQRLLFYSSLARCLFVLKPFQKAEHSVSLKFYVSASPLTDIIRHLFVLFWAIISLLH